MHQNINGLISKSKDIITVCFDDIAESGKQIDILCFTEHNTTAADVNTLMLPNYTLANYYCRKYRNGGTCILVRNDIKYKTLGFTLTMTPYLDMVAKLNVQNVLELCVIELLYDKIIILCISLPNCRDSFDTT